MQDLQPKHLSLHPSGIRVNSDIMESTRNFRGALETAVKQTTDFNVKLFEKEHKCILDLIRAASEPQVRITNIPHNLTVDGNCIPLGIL